MSVARGIVLSADDFGKLVIEATDREVARFGGGQLVEVTALHDLPVANGSIFPGGYYVGSGWSDSSALDGVYWERDEVQHRRQIPALLTTRCGCTKNVIVEYPPPPVFRVVMSTGSVMWQLETSPIDSTLQSTYRVRDFGNVQLEHRTQAYEAERYPHPPASGVGWRHYMRATYEEQP